MSTEQVKRCCEIAGCVLVFWPRDSQSGIARPPCRHGNNRSALRFYWNSPRIPPPPICRGSRGRQGSNVGPTPSQSSSPPSSCHVMVTRDGIALHFLHRRAIDVLSREVPCSAALSLEIPPNHVLIIPWYIATLWICTQEERRSGKPKSISARWAGSLAVLLCSCISSSTLRHCPHHRSCTLEYLPHSLLFRTPGSELQIRSDLLGGAFLR